MAAATAIMHRLNPYAFHTVENGRHVFIEEITDADGRFFKVEYRCAADGSNATAHLLYNPWGGNPFSYEHSHLASDGFICFANGLHRDASPYGLEYAIERVHGWCNGYSFLREHGWAATCAAWQEWCSRG